MARKKSCEGFCFCFHINKQQTHIGTKVAKKMIYSNNMKAVEVLFLNCKFMQMQKRGSSLIYSAMSSNSITRKYFLVKVVEESLESTGWKIVANGVHVATANLLNMFG